MVRQFVSAFYKRQYSRESARATGLYDRRSDEVSLDEVERIGI
jgi:hypothetical protein